MSGTGNPPPVPSPLARFYRQVGRIAGYLAFAAALAGILSAMGMDSTYPILKIADRYEAALFYTPLTAVFLILASWIGGRFASGAQDGRWWLRVLPVWDIDGLEDTAVAKTVAVISLVAFTGLPAVGTVWSFGKFLNGSYFYFPGQSHVSCDGTEPVAEKCDPEGSVIWHLLPKHRLSLPTHHVYQGGVDFLPVIEPALFTVLVAASLFFAARLLLIICSRPTAARDAVPPSADTAAPP